jgi:hypothetical protein
MEKYKKPSNPEYCEIHAENFTLILQGTGVRLSETFF